MRGGRRSLTVSDGHDSRGYYTVMQFMGTQLLQLSQPNFKPTQSWCDHIIEWNPPHPTTTIVNILTQLEEI